MVAMLSHTMADFSATNAASISQLQELRKSIQEAGAIDDMGALQTRLSECLESIQNETKRQQDDSARIAQLEDKKMPGGRAKAPIVPEDIDPLTGLGLRVQAEKAIQDACDDSLQTYAGVFLVDRIQVISSRFGVSLGDKLVLFFLQYLSQGLSPSDQIFRWSRGAFVAVMERQESFEHVKRELARLFSRRIEQTFEMGDRSVVIPVASTWMVAPLSGSTPGEIGRKTGRIRRHGAGSAGHLVICR